MCEKNQHFFTSIFITNGLFFKIQVADLGRRRFYWRGSTYDFSNPTVEKKIPCIEMPLLYTIPVFPYFHYALLWTFSRYTTVLTQYYIYTDTRLVKCHFSGTQVK